MPKNKTNKEFAIKLIHPIFGDFYFSYFAWNDIQHHYVFVKNTLKVSKWKTINFSEKHINLIQEDLKSERGKIMLSFGSEVDESLKSLMIESKKKYYLPITTIRLMSHLNNAKENINKSNKEFKYVSINFLDTFKKIQDDLIFKLKNYILDNNSSMKNIDIDKYLPDINNFTENTNILYQHINNYISDKKIIEESIDYNDVYLDIVDASYNFRCLKLKILKTIE